jgi:hypothetical protein
MKESFEQSKEVTKKKVYQRPDLKRYGTVEQITFANRGSNYDRAPGNRRP